LHALVFLEGLDFLLARGVVEEAAAVFGPLPNNLTTLHHLFLGLHAKRVAVRYDLVDRIIVLVRLAWVEQS
jgi:hypothetical protein